MRDPILELLKIGEVNYFVQLIARIFFSVLVSIFLGVERANKRHAAGLRTFITVSLTGTIAALIDTFIMDKGGLGFPIITSGLAIGLAIISSYTIIYSSKNQIKGLTTSVALYSQAFVGAALGFGMYTVGLIAVIILIISLSLLPKAEIYLKNRSSHFEIHLELKNKTDLAEFVTVIRDLGMSIDDIEINPAYANSGLSVYTISLTIFKDELKQYKTHTEIIEALKTIPYISFVEEITM